jgi:hypothetical protein
MVNFITTADKTNPSYLSQCDKRLDLKNYTDYIAAELWYGNTDWIYNNIKIARTRTTDNKWRFFLQDLEWGLGGWTDYNSNMFDWFQNAIQPNTYYDIHSNLMQDSTYRNYFINRYADLMNTTLHQNTYTPIINQMYEVYKTKENYEQTLNNFNLEKDKSRENYNYHLKMYMDYR